jgi:hypothetical protein
MGLLMNPGIHLHQAAGTRVHVQREPSSRMIRLLATLLGVNA